MVVLKRIKLVKSSAKRRRRLVSKDKPMEKYINSLKDLSIALSKDANKIKIKHSYSELYNSDLCYWELCRISNSDLLEHLEEYLDSEVEFIKGNTFKEDFYNFFVWSIEEYDESSLYDQLDSSSLYDYEEDSGWGSSFGLHDEEEVEDPSSDNIFWGVEIFINDKKKFEINANDTF